MKIAIFESSSANLRSVYNALVKLGSQPIVGSKPAELRVADAIIFPGVGSFAKVMNDLQKMDAVAMLKELIGGETKPFLGICLGMQILFEVGLEGPEPTPGLGILPGRVEAIPADAVDFLPHIGWNTLHSCSASHEESLLLGASERHVYFVHSYHCMAERQHVLATTTVGPGNLELVAAVGVDNIYGVQFHPEKSGGVGLNILANFLNLVGSRM